MRITSIGRRVVFSALLGLIGYVASYLYLRSIYTEQWAKDGRAYVIFPEQPIMIYYFYRPLSVVDARVTGMRFHIGPHEE